MREKKRDRETERDSDRERCKVRGHTPDEEKTKDETSIQGHEVTVPAALLTSSAINEKELKNCLKPERVEERGIY